MYKISLKSKSVVTRTLLSIPRRNIISHSVLTGSHAKSNIFHLHGEIQGNTAFVTMNREHKQNTLSPTMIKELTRFLKSFDLEPSVRGIWLGSNSNEVFSKGTDFKLLHQSVLNQQHNVAYDYLRKLYDFGVFLGKFNKPIVLSLKGEIMNSAASIFPVLPFTFANKKTIWYLNETSLGYIPDSGASFFLSRMKGELGTYLALTGAPLFAEDLVFSDIVLDKWMDEHEAKNGFKTRNRNAFFPLTSFETFYDPNLKKDLFKKLDKDLFDEALKNELNCRIRDHGENPRLVLSEILYKKKMSEFANYSPKNRFMAENRPLLNHLTHYKLEVVDNMIADLESEAAKYSNLPMDAINRCFCGNTMEEIEDALKSENTQWAKDTLHSFKMKSLLSLKLTLKLMREGVKSSWAECLSREFRVACRRINDEEFKNGVKSILYDKKKKCYDWKYKNFQEIPQALVDQYFRPLDEDLKIPEYQADLKPHALYPVKDYYEILPDTIRFFLNEESTYDSNIREDQNYATKTFLQDNHVDFQNPNYATGFLREKFSRMNEAGRKLQTEQKRAFQILSSSENIALFYERRKVLINEKFSKESEMKELIKSTISRIFSEKLNEKFANFKENCRLTHYQSRRDFFLKMKYFVFNNNFLYNPLDDQKIKQLAKNMSLPLFFPDNSSDSFLDVPNPELVPGKFPPAKITQFAKKIPIGEDWTVYKVSDKEEISKFMKENKEILSKNKNQRDLYFKPSAEALAMREKQFEFNRKYNLGKREREFRENYIKSVLKYAKRSRETQKYILDNFQNVDYDELFFEDQQAKYKDIAIEFLGEMRVKEKLSIRLPGNEAEMASMKKRIEEIEEINKSIKKEYDGDRLDLQLEGNLRYNSYKKLNERNIMEQVLNYLESNKELTTLFDPLVTKVNGNYGDELRDRYLKLFLKIYTRHYEEILMKEYKEFKSAAPILTKDGKSSVLLEKNDSFMEIFDDFIHRQVGIDFHKIIMDDVLYIFSFFILIDLEKRMNFFHRLTERCETLYNPPPLNDGIPFYTKRIKEYEERIIKFYKANNVEIEKFEDLQELTSFLNNLTENMGGIYAVTRNKVKFPNTRLYKAYQEKINENYREHSGFMEKVAAKYELKTDMERKLKRLEEEKMNINITRDNNEFDFSARNVRKMVQKKFSKDLHPFIENEIPRNEQKIVGTGLLNYLRKLEGLTARGINGKFNFLPTEYDFPKEVDSIPDYFGFKDPRQSAEKWLEDKIYEYLKKFFEVRFVIEKGMTKNELALLDLDLLQNFSPEKLKKTIEKELQYEYGILKLMKEQYQHDEHRTDSMSLNIRPPDIEKYHENRVQNPEGYNKLIAFAIKNVAINDEIQNRKMDPEKKLTTLSTYIRLQKELYTTPDVESYTDESKDKAYKDMRSVGMYKVSKQMKDIKDLKQSVKLDLRHEIHTILGAFDGRDEVKQDVVLKSDIQEFLEKFKDLK